MAKSTKFSEHVNQPMRIISEPHQHLKKIEPNHESGATLFGSVGHSEYPNS